MFPYPKDLPSAHGQLANLLWVGGWVGITVGTIALFIYKAIMLNLTLFQFSVMIVN